MTSIYARIPQIDWDQGFRRHWNGGNPAVTHAFNALSFMFPQAENYFIEIVREVAHDLDIKNHELGRAIKGFIAQEATHSHQHNQYNAVLEKQGFENVVHDFINRLQEQSRRSFSSLTKLAIVCGYEHYTAILGNYILRNPQVLNSAEPDLALVWGWHSAEETEHKAVCFDLYREAGGGWFRRELAFLLVTFNFSLMFGRLYLNLLYRDGCLKPSRLAKTLQQSLSFFFGVSGIAWHLIGYGVRYLSPWFHPWDNNNRFELEFWISSNHKRLRSSSESRER